MRPRQSGGGTAQDPLDFTLSDTEPVSSDAPVTIYKAKLKSSQSSESNIVETVNVKRVRPGKEVRDGEASTSQLALEIPATKRSRLSPPGGTSSSAVESTQPVRKKSTARKSSQNLASAQRRRWEANRASNLAANVEDNDKVTHEEAMRQAAVTRRLSQSSKKPSHSPTKANTEAGPEPSTSHHTKATTGDHPEIDSPVPVSAPASSSGRVKPSPFQICDTPGSWGSAIPISVPRSGTRKTNIVVRPGAIAGPIFSVTGTVPSLSAANPSPVSADLPAPPPKPARNGPTWRTAESPPLITMKVIVSGATPAELFGPDGFIMKESDDNDEQPLADPEHKPEEFRSGRTFHDHDDIPIDLAILHAEMRGFQPSSPLPDLPPLDSDIQLVEDAISTASDSTNINFINATTSSHVIPGPARPTQEANLPALTAEEQDVAEIDLLLPSSDPIGNIITDNGPLGDLLKIDAALLNMMPADITEGNAFEVDDVAESLAEEVDHTDLSRSRASSSGGSFEEIPAEIARRQVVFSRPTATQALRQSDSSQLVLVGDFDVPEQRVLPSKLDNIGRDSITRPEAGSSRPRRVKISHQERAKSSSSSSSGSPSKRLSTRLASRTITPVYNFGNGREPIKWRQTVEMDGESDVEDLLRAPSRAESSGSSSVTIDGIERTLTATFNVPILDSSPPPERRSRAIRHFDTQLIDEWNKKSPGLTKNPALHRLIFESYIDQCVDGNEPEIKVFNTVDLESIPPNFEFQYSNNMLYHEDVPEPELGLGCDCEGGCSVTSETCSCLKRQRLYNYGIAEDFAYEEDGTLKQPVPIWECGPTCGCPPECMNRVIQRGRTNKALIDLFKTKKKGWGVRARCAIPKGTFLGIYSGEVIPEAESERRGWIYEKAGRTYLFDCDGYHIANPPKGLEEVDPRLAVLVRDSAARAAQAAAVPDSIGTYNAYSIDAFHYGYTRFFNHSCYPNIQIVQAYVDDFHPERPLLVIFSLYDVEAGQELCISYKGLPDEEEEVEDKTKKSGKRRKIKKPKRTAAVHVSHKTGAHKDTDACYCGADNCDGKMFNR